MVITGAHYPAVSVGRGDVIPIAKYKWDATHFSNLLLEHQGSCVSPTGNIKTIIPTSLIEWMSDKEQKRSTKALRVIPGLYVVPWPKKIH